MNRWNNELKALADACGFTPRLCRPYRAKTKGNVERFNSYLKGSFVVPLGLPNGDVSNLASHSSTSAP